MELNRQYDAFAAQGVALIGIAGQQLPNLEQYVKTENIRFPLLADETREIIKAYEIFIPIKWDSFRIAIPSTFLLDSQQIIRYAYIGESQFDRPKVADLLQAVKELPID